MTMESNNNKSLAAITHLSAFSQYIIPFGNFIIPIIIWSTHKKDEFINHHGKQVINFQLSVFLYSVIMTVMAIPILLFTIFKNLNLSHLSGDQNDIFQNMDIANITGIAIVGVVIILLFIVLKIMEIFLVIYAAVKASNGSYWKYPFMINFIK